MIWTMVGGLLMGFWIGYWAGWTKGHVVTWADIARAYERADSRRQERGR